MLWVLQLKKGSGNPFSEGVLRRGVSRRCLERPLGEHDPLGGHPNYGAQSVYRFLLFGNEFPNCAGHLLHRAFWQELFCATRGPHKVLSVHVQIMHTHIVWESISDYTHTSVKPKNCFRSICVIVSGLIVSLQRPGEGVSHKSQTCSKTCSNALSKSCQEDTHYFGDSVSDTTLGGQGYPIFRTLATIFYFYFRGKFTKNSRQTSRHPWQRKTETIFTPHFCRVVVQRKCQDTFGNFCTTLMKFFRGFGLFGTVCPSQVSGTGLTQTRTFWDPAGLVRH